jgi:hypothetical protein
MASRIGMVTGRRIVSLITALFGTCSAGGIDRLLACIACSGCFHGPCKTVLWLAARSEESTGRTISSSIAPVDPGSEVVTVRDRVAVERWGGRKPSR